jgi:hypothetical protein
MSVLHVSSFHPDDYRRKPDRNERVQELILVNETRSVFNMPKTVFTYAHLQHGHQPFRAVAAFSLREITRATRSFNTACAVNPSVQGLLWRCLSAGKHCTGFQDPVIQVLLFVAFENDFF